MNDQTKDQTIPKSDAPDAGGAGEKAGTAAGAKAAAGAAKKDAKPKKDAAALEAGASEATVVVTGPEKGRWRAGRKFSREPISIPLADLAEGDLERLQADPELHVQIVDAPY